MEKRRHPLSEPFVGQAAEAWAILFGVSNGSDLNHFQSNVTIVGVVAAAVFRLEELLKCGCHSFCWKMSWELDKLSGFPITPSTSAFTSRILASKRPMGQKCCMSCLDLENVYIYRITRFSTNKYQVQSPQLPVSDPMANSLRPA